MATKQAQGWVVLYRGRVKPAGGWGITASPFEAEMKRPDTAVSGAAVWDSRAEARAARDRFDQSYGDNCVYRIRRAVVMLAVED